MPLVARTPAGALRPVMLGLALQVADALIPIRSRRPWAERGRT
jgi:hypothetical protein